MATRARDVLLSLATLLGVLGLAAVGAFHRSPGPPRTASLRPLERRHRPRPGGRLRGHYIRWLVDRSMLTRRS